MRIICNVGSNEIFDTQRDLDDDGFGISVEFDNGMRFEATYEVDLVDGGNYKTVLCKLFDKEDGAVLSQAVVAN